MSSPSLVYWLLLRRQEIFQRYTPCLRDQFRLCSRHKWPAQVRKNRLPVAGTLILKSNSYIKFRNVAILSSQLSIKALFISIERRFSFLSISSMESSLVTVYLSLLSLHSAQFTLEMFLLVIELIPDDQPHKDILRFPSVRFLARYQLSECYKLVPTIHKRHLNRWFHALVDAFIHQELLSRFVFTFCYGANCNSAHIPDVIRSVEIHANSKLFLVLFKHFPQ